MNCDLCKHEQTQPNHLLCASCAEMVQRLVVVNQRMQDLDHQEEVRNHNLSIVSAGASR